MFGGLSPVVGASDQLHCLDTGKNVYLSFMVVD